MARPKPTIVLEDTDNTGKTIQVCEADKVYAVCYKGRPVTIRTNANIEMTYPVPKYIKSTYTNPGHAFNLAERMNQQFDTTDFDVMLMSPGRVIKE